jgi:hypothetical protein
MKNDVFWDITPCGSCNNRRFGVTYQSEFHTSFLSHFVFFRSVRWLLVTAIVVPSSPILVTLMMEALRSSETPVLTRATRPNIPRRRHSSGVLYPRNVILHGHRRENLKSCELFT